MVKELTGTSTKHLNVEVSVVEFRYFSSVLDMCVNLKVFVFCWCYIPLSWYGTTQRNFNVLSRLLFMLMWSSTEKRAEVAEQIFERPNQLVFDTSCFSRSSYCKMFSCPYFMSRRILKDVVNILHLTINKFVSPNKAGSCIYNISEQFYKKVNVDFFV